MKGRNTMSDSTRTIKLSGETQRFYQGVAAATKVTEAHADTDFPDFATRERLFWFYAGALAKEAGCDTADDFAAFITGVTTRAPQEFPAVETISVVYGGVTRQFPAPEDEDVDATDDFLRHAQTFED